MPESQKLISAHGAGLQTPEASLCSQHDSESSPRVFISYGLVLHTKIDFDACRARSSLNLCARVPTRIFFCFSPIMSMLMLLCQTHPALTRSHPGRCQASPKGIRYGSMLPGVGEHLLFVHDGGDMSRVRGLCEHLWLARRAVLRFRPRASDFPIFHDANRAAPAKTRAPKRCSSRIPVCVISTSLCGRRLCDLWTFCRSTARGTNNHRSTSLCARCLCVGIAVLLISCFCTYSVFCVRRL